MKLTVFGAGAWGTALAIHACQRHEVVLWARDAAQAADMRRTRCNARYLGEARLPAQLDITSDFQAASAHAQGGLVLVATPMSGLSDMLQRLGAFDGGVMWVCKGFEQGTGLLGHEIARSTSPGLRAGVLSGPSFAIEVAQGRPTALVAASGDAALREEAVSALHGENLRIYTSADPTGVEVGGAVKNVMAIATGVVDGMGWGLNARAALLTRGLAEMTRLGVALGARAETFMGLSGLGDLVLTATGDLSRNRKVGLLLAQGFALPDILRQLGHVAEGVRSAPVVWSRAQSLGVDMPITEAVVQLLEVRSTVAQMLEQMMGRRSRTES